MTEFVTEMWALGPFLVGAFAALCVAAFLVPRLVIVFCWVVLLTGLPLPTQYRVVNLLVVVAVWFVAQLVFARRRGYYRSRIAGRVWETVLPRKEHV